MKNRKEPEMTSELLELRKRIERNKLELKRAENELKSIGMELKSSYIRQMCKSSAGAVSGESTHPALNRMCLGCFNSCKQPETVKIYHCAKYDPL